MRFERHDWTMPMPVLRTTMQMKLRFFNDPVRITRTARTRLMRLKSVQRFSMTSSLTDLDLRSVLTLT